MAAAGGATGRTGRGRFAWHRWFGVEQTKSSQHHAAHRLSGLRMFRQWSVLHVLLELEIPGLFTSFHRNRFINVCCHIIESSRCEKFVRIRSFVTKGRDDRAFGGRNMPARESASRI
jgi:hypothetical protein